MTADVRVSCFAWMICIDKEQRKALLQIDIRKDRFPPVCPAPLAMSLFSVAFINENYD